MLTIICAYNNKEVLEKYLLKSLQKQTVQDYELILLDAKELGTKTAAATLNYGAEKAQNDTLVFVHQDVEFLEEYALEKIEAFSRTHTFAIAGVAGVKKTRFYKVFSSVLQGKARKPAGKLTSTVTELEAVDECLFIIPKSTFAGFGDLGATWHFYAVEYCIRARSRGEKVLLCPIPVYHLSTGDLNASYYDTLLTVAEKYPAVRMIRATVNFFPNDWTLPLYCSWKKKQIERKKRRNAR